MVVTVIRETCCNRANVRMAVSLCSKFYKKGRFHGNLSLWFKSLSFYLLLKMLISGAGSLSSPSHQPL